MRYMPPTAAKKPKSREGSERGKECQWEDLAQGESPRQSTGSFGMERRAEHTDLSIGREGLAERPRMRKETRMAGGQRRDKFEKESRHI